MHTFKCAYTYLNFNSSFSMPSLCQVLNQLKLLIYAPGQLEHLKCAPSQLATFLCALSQLARLGHWSVGLYSLPSANIQLSCLRASLANSSVLILICVPMSYTVKIKRSLAARAIKRPDTWRWYYTIRGVQPKLKGHCCARNKTPRQLALILYSVVFSQN